MTHQTPIETTNLDRYGNEPLAWSRVLDQLVERSEDPPRTWWLGTTRPDGRPHAAGVGAVVHDGELYFTSGPETRKSRNLAANPHCTISVKLDDIDVVFEGEASRMTDPAIVESVVAVFRDGGWPATAEDDAITAPFSAPSAGPPPWHLYHFAFYSAIGVANAEPHGATRWRFAR